MFHQQSNFLMLSQYDYYLYYCHIHEYFCINFLIHLLFIRFLCLIIKFLLIYIDKPYIKHFLPIFIRNFK